MTKSYKNTILKKNRVYSVEQLMVAYGVTANTVSNWVKAGLMPSDAQKPYVFRGAVVMAFHKHRRSRQSRKLLSSQFQCWSCQAPVKPAAKTITKARAANGRPMLHASCPSCSSKVQKITTETDCDNFQDCRNPNTPTDCLHEEKTSIRGDIWTDEIEDNPIFYTKNDRIIHKWQTYAGCYNEKTVVQHLAAIRYFEKYLNGKLFLKLSIEDFAAMRDELKRRANVSMSDSMSASSIKHTVSHLVTFFDWLLMQDGYRRLPKDFAGYLKLPKAVVASSAQLKKREFPSILEAEELLSGMPSFSLVQKRAQAIFALAFLGALRADTLVSLQIKHFDIDRKLILQVAREVRAKAGKSVNVFWFPIPIAFERVVLEWVGTLQSLGFTGNDVLFPDAKYLKHRISVNGSPAAPVPVMTTKHAVTAAFNIACRNSEINYTPHASKHTIGAERDNRALTHEERKAWSLNMGHDDEQTTERYYGTMAEDRRFEVLESIGSKKTIDPQNMSETDKAKAFDAMILLLSNKT